MLVNSLKTVNAEIIILSTQTMKKLECSYSVHNSALSFVPSKREEC